jgi:acyl-CoA synthetase (AMP-forming)/AMP-acid ligase II
MSNIADVFFRAAAKDPDRIAIIHRDGSITYGELARLVRSTAAHFRRKGLGHGDRVLVFVPMGIDLYRVVLALFSIGAGAVFLDAWVGWKRMELCCELARCKGFIGGWKARTLGWLSGPVRQIPIKLGASLPPEGGTDIEAVDPDATALITFTTGSTGTPKAARRSHGFLAAQFDALIEELEPAPADVDMTTLPIVLFLNLGIGCTSVIPDFKPGKPASFRGEVVADELRRHKVDRLTASPSQVMALAGHLLATGTRLPALRKVFTGGAPVFPRDAALMCQAFPDAQVKVVFGSTECEPISSITAAKLLQDHAEVDRGLCVGSVFYRTALCIIGIEDRPVPHASATELDAMTLPANALGEIIVSGEHVLRSYFNNEEAFRRNKIIVDDTVWHRTGDSGFVDGQGVLFLTGRCAQLIHRNGQVLAPFVWEDRLLRHRGVVRGTLIDREGAIVAVVQAASDADRAALRAELLSAHSMLGRVQFIDRMPMDPRHQSKIDHEVLRRMVPR